MSAIERLCAANDDTKRNSPTFAMAADVRDFLAVSANMKATEAFMEKALGLSFSPSPEGKNYYRSLLKSQLTHYQQDLGVDRLVNSTRLGQFFAARNNLLRPMTSLRDVDQPGLIHESGADASYKRVADGMTARTMKFIRRGSGAASLESPAQAQPRERANS